MSIESITIVCLFTIVLLLQYYVHLKKVQELQAKLLDEKKTTIELQPTDKNNTLESEIIKLKNTIEDTTVIAQEATLIKHNFLTNIGHEIRTPMNAILVFSQMIKKESLDKNISSYAKDIFTSGHNLLHLLNNMIEISAIDSGDFKININAVDLKVFIDSVIEVHRFEANQKALKFIVDIDENIPESIVIDASRVKEILDNLLDNALKFTRAGEIKFTVSLENFDASKHEVDISFRVKDTGIGILKANQEKIFKIFENKQINQNTQYQGTGLSLSINKKLASLMNGSLNVESELQKGATFTLILRSVEVVLVSKTYDIEESNIDFSMIKPKSVIVVIDDSQKTLNLVRDSFLKTEVKVYTYISPKEAITALQNINVDLILINVEILSMDDNAVAKVLKSISKAPLVSLVDDRLNNVEFHEDGVKPVAHLKKPLSKIDLFRVALKVLNSQEIFVSNGVIQELENKKGLHFESSEKESKEYFKNKPQELDNLLINALETNDLNTIGEFANSIHELAKAHKVKSLIIFSKELISKIDSFDIEGIDTMLKEYDKKAKDFR